VTLAPGWRALQVILGALLFVAALGLLAPLGLPRGPYVFLAVLLAAGAMALTDTLVALLVAMMEKLKGRRA